MKNLTNTNYMKIVGPTITWSEEQKEKFTPEELKQIAIVMFEAGEKIEKQIEYTKFIRGCRTPV